MAVLAPDPNVGSSQREACPVMIDYRLVPIAGVMALSTIHTKPILVGIVLEVTINAIAVNGL
jgi:hypothetical protein